VSTLGEGIRRTKLENGLEVRLREIHTAPLISNWVWYRVGSRQERAGITGISHWVEHMQFKGTPKFPGNELDRLISRDGGYWNAMTWLDWTAYYETMPADRIELALQLEADRMMNSEFDPDEVESERTVIISERQGHENEPTFRLSEEVQAAAFRVHAYHHEVIGDKADLETMTREDLHQHYQKYYVPSNAILVVAGDFQTEAMLERVLDLYGVLPERPAPEDQVRAEPEQMGERRVTVEGPGKTPYVEIGFHAPAGADEDFLALTVLDSVLTGASNLNIFGGGISNKTSRLYRALVDGEIAATVRGGLAATIDPYLYSIHVTVRPDHTPEQSIEVINTEIARLLEERIEEEELNKAIKQARALFAYNSESITNQAFWMGFSEVFADYSWFETYLDRIARVTPDDVFNAARRYLLLKNRIVGIYRPIESAAHE
jgi:zinc protease